MSYWVSRCESKKKNCTFWCSDQTIFILRRANVCITYAPFLSIKDTKTAPRLVAETTNYRLYEDSHQWWENPELTQIVGVCS